MKHIYKVKICSKFGIARLCLSCKRLLIKIWLLIKYLKTPKRYCINSDHKMSFVILLNRFFLFYIFCLFFPVKNQSWVELYRLSQLIIIRMRKIGLVWNKSSVAKKFASADTTWTQRHFAWNNRSSMYKVYT